MLATAIFVFASLWLGSLFKAYRGPNSLDFVTVRVDPAHKASLEPIMLHAVSPWGTRTPFSLDDDGIWRISTSRESRETPRSQIAQDLPNLRQTTLALNRIERSRVTWFAVSFNVTSYTGQASLDSTADSGNSSIVSLLIR